METLSNCNNRFLKLSLKKNRLKQDNETKKMNESPDVVILDDSFDTLKLSLHNNVQPPPIVYSPIVIQDSSLEESLPNIILSTMDLNKIDRMKTPSKSGNISFNCSKEDVTPKEQAQPSYNGWSPAQNIICATPKQTPVPSTNKDQLNESSEQCSIKKVQKSQKKLLSDLYGEVWKSIPTLFKTKMPQDRANFDGCAKKLNFDDDDKENFRHNLKSNKEWYLTWSDTKIKGDVLTNMDTKNNADINTDTNLKKILTYTDLKKQSDVMTDTEKKSKKKLFTEKVNTPEFPKPKLKMDVRSTSKKLKVTKEMSVTDLVKVMNDVDILANKVERVVLQSAESGRLSFIASLADDVPSWRCNTEAIQYRDSFKMLKEQLTRRLFTEFNKCVFDNALDADLPIIWNTKLRSTAGLATNRRLKTANGDRIRSASIKLSTKVVDTPQRLRDTLIHEMCHVATWLIDGELKAGHGPLWKKWATRSMLVFPELGEIKRCHNMEIHFKYTYRCTKCGYSYQRHSKSIDITKKACGYCRGTFEIILNKKTKDGVVSTPAKKGNANDFALYVKENYGAVKNGKTHAEVMKVLGEQFSAKKNKVL